MSLLEAEGLEKRFGRVRALRGVGLALERGSCALVVGSNGAGKSTLLRILAGLSRPSRGHVRLLGSDLFHGGAEARSRIGYLGSQPGLYGELSVAENLAFSARLHAAPPARAERVLEQLGLEPVRDRAVRTLSQGYRRRAGLARAALAEPDLLLLDEPWNGLDPEASKRLRALLAEACGRGAAVLVAVPSAEAADARFDRVLRLEEGKLVAGTERA